MKDCCHTSLFARAVKIWLGRQADGQRFTCQSCGQSYERSESRVWMPVTAVQDLQNMVAESNGKGHLTTEKK